MDSATHLPNHGSLDAGTFLSSVVLKIQGVPLKQWKGGGRTFCPGITVVQVLRKNLGERVSVVIEPRPLSVPLKAMLIISSEAIGVTVWSIEHLDHRPHSMRMEKDRLVACEAPTEM